MICRRGIRSSSNSAYTRRTSPVICCFAEDTSTCVLPAEFELDRRCCTSIGWRDPRSTAGELLWPQRINEAALKTLKVTLGSYRYAGQFQQRPAPADGGMLKRHWWRYWQPRGANLPPV